MFKEDSTEAQNLIFNQPIINEQSNCDVLSGDNYWVFDAERKITGPDSVRRLGLPVTDINAALKWEEGHIEKVYLLKSAFYWPFNVHENHVDDAHPRNMLEWAGLPGHIDAAFRDNYGNCLPLS